MPEEEHAVPLRYALLNLSSMPIGSAHLLTIFLASTLLEPLLSRFDPFLKTS